MIKDNKESNQKTNLFSDVIIGEGFWQIFEHNKRSHSIEFAWKGKVHFMCARCTGMYIGMLLFFSISILFSQANISFPLAGSSAFWFAWIMAVPAILDWSTSKVGFRTTNNAIRFITGYFLGIGIIVYFWVGWSLIYTIGTLFLSKVMVMLPIGMAYLMREGWSLNDIIRCGKLNVKSTRRQNIQSFPSITLASRSSQGDDSWCVVCLCIALCFCCCAQQGFRCIGCPV